MPLQWNEATGEQQRSNPMWMPNLLGLTKTDQLFLDTVWDLLVLMSVFFHKSCLETAGTNIINLAEVRPGRGIIVINIICSVNYAFKLSSLHRAPQNQYYLTYLTYLTYLVTYLTYLTYLTYRVGQKSVPIRWHL